MERSGQPEYHEGTTPLLTVRQALLQGTKLLDDAGIGAPRLTAEVLLAHAVRHPKQWLYAHSEDQLREVWWIHYGRYLHERLSGKPTQYITGVQEFYGRDFRVTQDVLIPRPESEHLVEMALKRLPPGPIADVGTGSGIIAITLALETPQPVFAVDISAPALAVAKSNATALRANVSFAQSDLLTALGCGTMQTVVSNPPYIPYSQKDSLQREVRDFEPHLALFAEDDGMEVYRRLIADCERVLKPGGWLLMEVAYDGAGKTRSLLSYPSGNWSEIEIEKDLAGHSRVIAAKWK